ncbi:MAG: hypothetical protein V7765_11545 [Oleispira sp.]
MLKIIRTSRYGALSLAIALVGCSANDSSTTIGAAPVIDPIEVNKTIAALDWDQNNEVEMASHAYRAVARHSMLATLYSGQSAIFTSFINLVQGSRDRSCNASGSIDAVLVEPVCKNAASAVVPCTITDEAENKIVANPDVAITTTEQSAIFYRCQDGITSGSYFDGPLRVVLEDDFSVDGIYKNTTTVSAVSQVSQQSENGKFVLNSDDEVVKVDATDFLMQNEFNTFFMSYEYNLTTSYDTSIDRFDSPDISECTTADVVVEGVVTKLGTSIVTREVLETNLVAGLQEPSPQFSYTEFTDLDLIATKTNFRCEDIDEDAVNGNESLRFNTSYSLATKIESKALGTDTQFSWTDLVIPTDQKNIEGTIVLTHTNQDTSSHVVTVVFDKLGNLTVNAGLAMTVQEFLNLSKAEVVVAE